MPVPIYTILLIITDGIIDDMSEAKRLLVQAGTLPLSVIIIGVGNADFTNMETLDGDIVLLTDDQGNKTVRDCVQFVKFSSAKDKVIFLF